MQDDLFEWDDEKAKTNKEKHSISFDYAAELLIDDYVAFRANVKGEERFKAIARDRGEYFVVIYTKRGSRIRIISARHATKKEANDYERYFD